MVCKECKKRIKKDTAVCPYCGTPQTETVSLGAMHDAGRKKGKKPLPRWRKILAPILFVLLIASLAAGYFLDWHWMLLIQIGFCGLGLAVLGTGILLTRKWSSWVRIVLTVFAVLLILAGALFRPLFRLAMEWYLDSTRDETKQQEVEQYEPEDVGVNTALPTTGVINIALFGLDNRQDKDDGRSDAIIVLSVDRDHNKIKLISIARDTLANVKDYGWNDNSRDDDWTKLTHAFYFGANSKDETKTGPSVAVRALNENFNLNITKYAFVNFHDFARVIDLVGGVEIDVEWRELAYMNKHIQSMNRTTGMQISQLRTAGKQTLTGGQALAYARLRHVDSDIKRGNRQKAVIDAVLKKAKKAGLSTCLDLLDEALNLVNTNLTNKELSELAMWFLEEAPETVNYSIPEDEDGRRYTWDSYGSKGSDTFQRYGSVYVMDLDYVAARISDIIYETNNANLEEAQKLSAPQLPAHMLEQEEPEETDTP